MALIDYLIPGQEFSQNAFIPELEAEGVKHISGGFCFALSLTWLVMAIRNNDPRGAFRHYIKGHQQTLKQIARAQSNAMGDFVRGGSDDRIVRAYVQALSRGELTTHAGQAQAFHWTRVGATTACRTALHRSGSQPKGCAVLFEFGDEGKRHAIAAVREDAAAGPRTFTYTLFEPNAGLFEVQTWEAAGSNHLTPLLSALEDFYEKTHGRAYPIQVG